MHFLSFNVKNRSKLPQMVKNSLKGGMFLDYGPYTIQHSRADKTMPTGHELHPRGRTVV